MANEVTVIPRPWLWKPRTKPIRFLEIHATRGGGSPDIQFQATINWMQSPNNRGGDGSWGGSCSYVIGRDGSLANVLRDDQMPTYGAGYGGPSSTFAIDEYGIAYEFCQSANQEEFTTAQYERGAVEFAAKCRVYSIPPVTLPYFEQHGDVPIGFVRHDRCQNGRVLGKSDPGPRWREADFETLVREKLQQEEEGMTNEQIIAEIRSLRDGEFVQDGYIVFRVVKKADMDVAKLFRIDDSNAAAITSPPRTVSPFVAMYLWRGDGS